jgi:uncharacterized protein (DUF1501 family)
MLTIFDCCRSPATCNGVSRRDVLRIGTLGFAGFGLADLLRVHAKSAEPSRQTSVILLWLGGGPSQHETFDPKPDTPEDYRSLVGTVATTAPGVRLGGLLPEIARRFKKMAIVRSFAHRDPSHEGATHWLQTGRSWPIELISSNPTPQPQFRPAIGAIAARVRGPIHPQTSVPAYCVVDSSDARHRNDGAAWLGHQYGPLRLDRQNALNNNLTPRIPMEKLRNRRALLATLDRLERTFDQAGAMQGMDEFQQQAFRILSGSVKEVLDLSREDVKTREKYGAGLGERLLLARRLCEAGAAFVTVNYDGWDHHGVSGSGPLREGLHKLCPPLDHAVATLIDDIGQRGLDQNILLVITGEFGRTPRIDGVGTKTTARHHWPELCPLALVGGGLRMGQVIGESTAKAERPKSPPISPEDLMATIFLVLGIDPSLQFKDTTGRPTSMIDKGKPIQELV